MNRYSVHVKTPPSSEPITLAEAKLHLRVDDQDEEDALIVGLIKAARDWTENYCRRSWVSRTLELRMDCFPEEIRLPRGPVSAVSSIAYLDQSGQSTTMSASGYQVDLYGTPPRIRTVFGGTWPVPQSGAMNAVTVEYVAGYANASAVPRDAKAAMLLIIGHLFQNRELVSEAALTEVPWAVKQLLAPLEIRDFSLE